MTELIEEFAQTEPRRKIDSYQGPATNQGYPSQAVQERSRCFQWSFCCNRSHRFYQSGKSA